MRALFKRFVDENAGSPILETAVVLPFILILGLGAIEFGYALYQYQMVASGLRTGARFLARVPQPNWQDTVPGDSRNFTYEQYAKSLAVIDSASGTSRVAGWSMSAVQISINPVGNCVLVQNVCSRALRGGDTIYTVVVSTDFMPTGLGFIAMLGTAGPLRIVAEHQERVIGQ